MRNYSIDKGKAVAILLVVLIHVTALSPEAIRQESSFYQLVHLFFGLGVPYFFAVSGYLLADQSSSQQQSHIVKMLKLHLWASVFYLIWDSLLEGVGQLIQGQLLWTQLEAFQGLTWLGLVNGTWGKYHLWYLWALVWGLGIWLWMRKLHPLLALVLTFALYYLLFDQASLIPLQDWFRYGGWPKALLYLNLGRLAGIYSFKLTRSGLVMGLLGGLGLYLWSEYQVSAWWLGEVFCLVINFCLLSLMHRYPGQASKWAQWGQESDAVYIMHVAVLSLLALALPSLDYRLQWPLFTALCLLLSPRLYQQVQKLYSLD
ncbi:acyltransferase family protein [Hutsoniella sourekii]